MNMRTKKLKSLLMEERLLVVPGASTALLARVVQDKGFDAVYATGAGISNMIYGYPDMGLVSMYEMLENTRRIVSAVEIPVIVDIDNAYGNQLNVVRTVREFCSAGASCLQMEDQAMPKKCGHFAGKLLISKAEMTSKIKAAKDTMGSDGLLIARTDAIAVNGFDDAMERAFAYEEAGADILFIEAPTTIEEMEKCASSFGIPTLANLVEGGRTPLLTNQMLFQLGYRIALYANGPLKAAVKGTQEFLERLLETGDCNTCNDLMISMEERNRLTKTEEFYGLEEQYRVKEL